MINYLKNNKTESWRSWIISIFNFGTYISGVTNSLVVNLFYFITITKII